ncbi:ABC transporter permease [Egicoccus sp. AB-alg2]|uniref:ABC transporter permease n=1 Tax=Egicoccus sp. AB-alg2 TaxID=3242693 RepID=UPI00359E51DC
MRAFRSEWVKLSRRSTLLGFGGAMIGFSLLFTILAFVNVGGGNIDLDSGGAESFVTTAALSRPGGSVFAATNVASFLGVIALSLFASNVAGEFSKGTLRTLFVTEPDRIKVFAGKIAALLSFTAIAVAATLAVSITAGALLAPGVGVETAAWWTADGLSAIGTTYLNLTSAALVPALLGATIAMLSRSAAIAISVGVAWFILGEALISAFWSDLAEWGPAAVTNALAVGGVGGPGLMGGPPPVIGYATAALLAVGYGAFSLLLSSAVLAKRDVTS